MSDNIVLNTGSGGDTTAAKDVSGIKHSRSLTETLNASGTPVDVSPTNPLPATVDSGLLMQRIESLELLLAQLLHGAGGQIHDGAGRTRVAIETTPAAGLTVGQAATATWNVAMGAAGSAMANLPALMLRDRIVVS